MASIEDVRDLVAGDHGLATISVVRDDGTIHSSVINAGVISHPTTGELVVAAVVRGSSWKLRRLRQTQRCTLVFRVGWQWISVDGPVDISGPEDHLAGVASHQVPKLLRDVFVAAGGSHDDWAEYDRVMAEDRRTAVLITAERIQSPRP